MDLDHLLHLLIPSWTSVAILALFFTYLAIAGSLLPGKLVPGATLPDGSRLHYRCNGLLSLLWLVGLLGVGAKMDIVSLTAISDRGLELLSTTFLFSVLVTMVLYAAGCKSTNRGSSLKPHVTGNLLEDWWFGIQLNPQFMGIDLKFFFVRAGMMGWLFINLSVLARSVQDGTLSQSMILFQLFCALYILDYFVHEEYMTSTWDIIAERLGFMLVFGDLVWIPFTFSIQGWWLLSNKVELGTVAVVANCLTFLIGYLVFRGANKQKHVFKKNPKAPIWGKPCRVIGGKLLASGYWGIARHCNYLGDLLLALSFSLPCGISSFKNQSAPNSQISPPLPADTTMTIDPNHTTASAAANMATAGAAAHNTTTTRPVRPAVSSPLPSNLYAAPSLQIRTQSPSSSPVAPAAANHQGVLYPLASSGRGFIPRPIRPAAAAGGEPALIVANAGAVYPSRPLLNFPPQQPIPVHLIRPNNSLAASPLPPPIRGLPLSSAPPEVAPSSVPDINGFKDMRDKSKDDNLAVIRGRKVRMTDGASLYVHCRSWLRNGFPEEIQPQYGDAVRSLPRPSPIPMASATLQKEGGEAEEKEEKGDDNKDEAEEHIECLSPHDLLERHVKRARKVRARLREERLQRIARYKSRLALLLPPLVEQFRNDLASGN